MASELKCCPFCGGTNILNDEGLGQFGESVVPYAAKCGTCGASFWHPDAGCGGQPKETWCDWNTRPTEDALRRRVEELEKALKDIVDDHDERVRIYPDMNTQEYRVKVMEAGRAAIAGEGE